MKWILVSLVLLFCAVFFFVQRNSQQLSVVSPLGIGKLDNKPLATYTIESLSQMSIQTSAITLGDITKTTESFIVRPFYFKSDGKNLSGIAHVPVRSIDSGNQQIKVDQKYPVIVQFRGYVDPTLYTPGMGTERSAQVFAKNGFISLAPDFLGYGQSDPLSGDIFKDRFETYTTALSLIASIPYFPEADATRIGIWGHSNGGQIALTVLEILQKPIPTSLWAPVTKPFPYSILYYTDDAEDHGKYLRKELALFESQYDVEKYSLTNYIERLTGPIQLHQGGNDTAVPTSWSDSFTQKLKAYDKNVYYYTYPNADHNMVPNWGVVVQRDVEFFNKNLH